MAADNRTITFNALAIMLVIVIPTMVATLAFAFWFRAGNERASYRPEFVYSGRLELLVWSIPILTILFLGGVIWIGSHRLDPHRPLPGAAAPLEVQVVALDWKWLFIYPDQQIATVNELVIPVGTPVHFRLTSATVMNVFFIPRLGSQIYAMNGMETELWLRADQAGSYYGRSAHFSGDGFARMHFDARAVPAGTFAGWVQQTRGQGATLDATSLAELARPSAGVAPISYGSVEAGLFQTLVHRAPMSGQASAMLGTMGAR